MHLILFFHRPLNRVRPHASPGASLGPGAPSRRDRSLVDIDSRAGPRHFHTLVRSRSARSETHSSSTCCPCRGASALSLPGWWFGSLSFLLSRLSRQAAPRFAWDAATSTTHTRHHQLPGTDRWENANGTTRQTHAHTPTGRPAPCRHSRFAHTRRHHDLRRRRSQPTSTDWRSHRHRPTQQAHPMRTRTSLRHPSASAASVATRLWCRRMLMLAVRPTLRLGRPRRRLVRRCCVRPVVTGRSRASWARPSRPGAVAWWRASTSTPTS